MKKKNSFEDKCNEKDKYMEDNDDNNEEEEMEDNDDNKKEEEENFQICLRKFSDLSGRIFRYVRENFQICPGKFSVFGINLFI